MRRPRRFFSAGVIAILLCVSVAAGARAAALQEPTGHRGHLDPGDAARSTALAPASPSPGPVLAYEPWLQGPGAPYSIGNLHPLALPGVDFAIGDFDGDGAPDLAWLERQGAGWSGTNRIEVWLNQGEAHFALRGALSPYPSDTWAIEAVDLNSDGLDDLLVLSADRISVFHAIGNGDFQFDHAIPGFDHARTFAVADMNRDGRPDVVVVDANRVAVLLNEGSDFVPGSDSPAPPTAVALAVGDFNGDGAPDVAVSTYGTPQSVSYYAGGLTALAAPVAFPTPEYSPHLAAGDLDGDGRDDLVSGGSYTISVWWGDGSAPLALRDEYTNPGSSDGEKVLVGDVDNDGRLDIAATRSHYGVAVFRNAGGRHFDDVGGWYTTSGRALYPGFSPFAFALADLDGDGLKDWLWSSETEQTPVFATVRGLGGAVYAGMALVPVPGKFVYPDWPGLTPVDFDRKGLPDLLVGSAAQSWLLRSREDGRFDPAQPFPLRGAPRALHLDPDALIDLVGAVNDSFYVYRTRPNGTLFAPSGYDGGALKTFVDFDGDGSSDALLLSAGSALVRFNDGHATFDRISNGFALPENLLALAAGDLDGDGLADLVLGFRGGNRDPDTLEVFVGLGDGNFDLRQVVALGPDPGLDHSTVRQIVIADVDGDGDLDVVTARGGSGTSTAYSDVVLNAGNGTLQLDDTYAIYGEDPVATVRDFNLDGLSDLATLSYTGTGIGRFQMRLNTGGVRFDDWAFQYLGPSYPRDLTIGDFNADGLPDVAYFTHGPGGLGASSFSLVVCYNVLNAPAGHRPRRGRLNPPGLHATPEAQQSPEPTLKLAIEHLSRDARGTSFDLSLPTIAPARFEVFDVFGRRVFTRRLDGRPGHFSVLLPRDALGARGIYWARLTQAGVHATRRFPLLN